MSNCDTDCHPTERFCKVSDDVFHFHKNVKIDLNWIKIIQLSSCYKRKKTFNLKRSFHLFQIDKIIIEDTTITSCVNSGRGEGWTVKWTGKAKNGFGGAENHWLGMSNFQIGGLGAVMKQVLENAGSCSQAKGGCWDGSLYWGDCCQGRPWLSQWSEGKQVDCLRNWVLSIPPGRNIQSHDS